jgi:hypothetical protein
MRRLNLIFAAFCFVFSSAAAAQGYWEKKQWNNWSKEEARKMLEDSPWAKKWVYTDVLESTTGESSQGMGRETQPSIYYIVQLRSALPVRQAVIRQAMINNKYERFSEEQKKEFDASAEAYLNKEYPSTIVVHIVYGSNVQFFERELARIWKGFPSRTVPVGANLITSSGKRVGAMQMVNPPGGPQEFELIFPRIVNGENLLSQSDKTLMFELPAVGATYRVYVEFKLEKMKFKGELVY